MVAGGNSPPRLIQNLMGIFEIMMTDLKRSRSGELVDFYKPTHNEILREEHRARQSVVDENSLWEKRGTNPIEANPELAD